MEFSNIEYQVLKRAVITHKHKLSKEYITDILYLTKPKYIQAIEVDKYYGNVGIVLVKLEKLISGNKQISGGYLQKETMKLFKEIWDES